MERLVSFFSKMSRDTLAPHESLDYYSIEIAYFLHKISAASSSFSFQSSKSLNLCYASSKSLFSCLLPFLFNLLLGFRFPLEPVLASPGSSISDRNEEVLTGVRSNFTGVRLEETVTVDSGKQAQMKFGR